LPPEEVAAEIAVELRERRYAGSGSWLNDTVVILLLPCALEATVLRETDPQTTIWELLLPEEAKRLPAELQAVDTYLDDECFLAPWRALFDRRLVVPRCRSTRYCGCCT
jgi:hypothetical protein